MINQIIKDNIDRYVKTGEVHSNFVFALLTNNLRDAFVFADNDNIENMHSIVTYLYNEIPANCWGSERQVEKYIDRMTRLRLLESGHD